jgi:hypothetical protein
MRFGFERRTYALLAGGLLLAVATAAVGAAPAKANDFLGVDIGPLSIGVGPNAPTYYAPPPAYVAPSVTYSSPPVVYQTPSTTYYSAPDSYTTYYAVPGTVVIR